jgi:hypothetical protein
MSCLLLGMLKSQGDYLQSPIDDLDSFYYTAQWAVAFNDGHAGKVDEGKGSDSFRAMIAGEDRENACFLVLGDLSGAWMLSDGWRDRHGYGLFFQKSLSVLAPWKVSLNALRGEWARVMDKAHDLSDEGKKSHLHYNFLLYGYRGVLSYFEIFNEHCDTLSC